MTFSFSDDCSDCCTSNKLPQLYCQFLETQLGPELERLTLEYETLWEFKPLSSLGQYIQSREELTLMQPFTSNELLNVLEQISNTNFHGNRKILLFDDQISECLGTNMLYTKKIMDVCRSHLLCISSAESLKKKNEDIEKKLKLAVPSELLTQDPTSLFWLHPFYANLLTKNSPEPLYSYTECCTLFLEFCLHSPEHIQNVNDALFEVLPTSKLADSIKFTYFHKDQIPKLLEQITRFIYKPSTLLSVCPNLTFENLPNNQAIFLFIEEQIHQFTKLNPFTAQYVYV